MVPGVKYALSFLNVEGELQTIFINKAGMMSAAPFGYNGLPKEVVANEHSLRSFFDEEFKKRNIAYSVRVFNDYLFVDEGEIVVGEQEQHK